MKKKRSTEIVITILLIVIATALTFLFWPNKKSEMVFKEGEKPKITFSAAEVAYYEKHGKLKEEVSKRINDAVGAKAKNQITVDNPENIFKKDWDIYFSLELLIDCAKKLEGAKEQKDIIGLVYIKFIPWKFSQVRIEINNEQSYYDGKKAEKIILGATDTRLIKKVEATKRAIKQVENVKTINMPKKKGYIFDGWYIRSEEKDILYDFSKPVKSELHLFAKWITETEYEKYMSSNFRKKMIETEKKERIIINQKTKYTSTGSAENFYLKKSVMEKKATDYVNITVYGTLPILIILVAIGLCRDFRAILWYKKRKLELRKERRMRNEHD